MSRDGVFAPQLTDGALHALQVEAQIIIHQVRLNGIATPRPAVTLDAVHKELAGGEVHRIGTHFPDAVQFIVIAAEQTALLLVKGKVFIVHRDGSDGQTCLDVDKAEGFALWNLKLGTCNQKLIQRFAVLLVEGLFPTLSIIYFYQTLALDILQNKIAHGFLAKVKKQFSIHLLPVHRFHALAGQLPFGRLLSDAIEVPRGCRHVDARAMSHAILIDPYLILISRQP